MFSIFPNFSRKKHFPENPHSLRQMNAAKNFKNFGEPPHSGKRAEAKKSIFSKLHYWLDLSNAESNTTSEDGKSILRTNAQDSVAP